MRFFVLLVFIGLSSHSFSQTFHIRSVSVEGTEKTKNRVITRQMTLFPGDTISIDQLPEELKVSQQNVYNLGLFNTVEVFDSLVNDSLDLLVKVTERWYVWPIPFVQLEERTFQEWWADKDLDRLVYGMGLEWNNFTGRNDRLYIDAQNGYSRRATLTYKIPFLFPRAKIDGGTAFYYANNKEVGYTTIGGILQLARLNNTRIRKSYYGQVLFSKRFTARKLLSWGAGYQHFQLDDSIVFFNPDYLASGKLYESYPVVYASYVNDQRDIKAFPLSGYKYGVDFYKNGLPFWGTSNFAKVALSFSHHIAITERWNFAYGTQNFFLLGKKVPYFDKYFVGFGSFLRGYEPYVIDGSFINLTKAEWKFGVFPRKMHHASWLPFRKFNDFPFGLYISAYADGGYVTDRTFNNQDNTLKNQFLLGYGAGLNVTTIYDVLIRAEYSRNLQGRGGIYFSGLVSIR